MAKIQIIQVHFVGMDMINRVNCLFILITIKEGPGQKGGGQEGIGRQKSDSDS